MTKTIIYTMLLFVSVGVGCSVYSKIQKLENQLLEIKTERDSLKIVLNQKDNQEIARQEEIFVKKVSEELAIYKLQNKIDKNNFEKELECMSKNIFFEARGESEAGQKAVAEVVMNRVASKKFPNTICKVVYAKKQFSWTFKKKNLNKKLTEKNKLYKKAKKIAIEVMLKRKTELKATHYHTHAVSPVWNKNMKQVAMIGEHRFFVN